MGEDLSTVYDLANGLIEGHGYPLILPSFTGAFQYLNNPERVIDCLDTRLALRAYSGIDGVYFKG